jgi:hypothetical protein
MSPTKKSQKVAYKFICESCDYKSCNKHDFNKHISTDKHKILQNPTSEIAIKKYGCKCGKIYKHASTLYSHRKTCTIFVDTTNNEKEEEEDEDEDEENIKLIQYLLKENSEFKQLMLEQNKQLIELAKNSAGHHNTNTNSHNNSFNLNFFLNETCKNAMNIMDFVNQLQIGIKELEETGRLGFADGISKIFINGLKQIDITNRPVHCSDLKRETLYIKSNGQWNKEDQDKALLTNAIKHVAHKNIKQIPEWTKENPQYKDGESKENDKYLKIVSESMSGSSEEETNKNYTKIIKSIAKETIIDR